ncbi:hypothetical protein AB1Y20_007575 [Prymnesium parvum]|uniref:Uncharacterized protein n=1 Tax=Prymnesium parvum TaxID=97485 RepID=A0AB34IV94_PRYPA
MRRVAGRCLMSRSLPFKKKSFLKLREGEASSSSLRAPKVVHATDDVAACTSIVLAEPVSHEDCLSPTAEIKDTADARDSKRAVVGDIALCRDPSGLSLRDASAPAHSHTRHSWRRMCVCYTISFLTNFILLSCLMRIALNLEDGTASAASNDEQRLGAVIPPPAYPAPALPAPFIGNVYERSDDAGKWGGSCTCPDGKVHMVGDMKNDCKSLACVGGNAVEPPRVPGPPKPPMPIRPPPSPPQLPLRPAFPPANPAVDFFKYDKAEAGEYGGACTCPNGKTYLVGDRKDDCGSLACYNGTAGECTRGSGDWSHNQVHCGAAPASYIEHMKTAFNERGLLLHLTTCRGDFCPKRSHVYFESILASGIPAPLENDCGHWCSAFTYLHSTLPMIGIAFPGFYSSVGLLYDPQPEVWDQVQCTSTTDSSTTTRSCCTCKEERYCPFQDVGSRIDSGYCHGPCRPDDNLCRQLAAGCGVSVADAHFNWGEERCSQGEILGGTCDLCRQPLWCDDANGFGFNGSIKGPEEWWDMFGYRDGGFFKGSRQCKWKPSQMKQWIGSMRERYLRIKKHGYNRDEPGLWNEVNIYSDFASASVMMRNLLGLVFIRGGGDEDPWHSSGTELDRTRLREIRDHWRTLGVEVPIFELSLEHWSELKHWNTSGTVDLTSKEFNLQYMDIPLNHSPG